MTAYHFDDFNGSGALASYWAANAGSTWSQANGGVAITSTNLDEQIVHQTIPTMGLPKTVIIETAFVMQQGAKYAGIQLFATSSALTNGNRLRFRWVDDFGQKYQVMLGGSVIQSVAIPASELLAQDGVTQHSLRVRAAYNQTLNSQDWYVLECYANDILVLPPFPRAVTWADGVHFGLLARRESFGVASPTLRFDWFGTRTETEHNHEPEPTLDAAVARTPITPSDETQTGSPTAFPVAVRVLRILNHREARRFVSDMGYGQTSQKFANVRRVIQCRWIGGRTERNTLQAYHAARVASATTNDHFTITIHPMSIGSITACFVEPRLDFRVLGPDVFACEFAIAEVF